MDAEVVKYGVTVTDLVPFPGMIAPALMADGIPEIEWVHGDDRCDCVYQRIGMWKNIYLAQTMEIRLCCLFNDLAQLFPNHFRMFNGYLDDNTGEWITEPQPWDGEDDMPKALWHRQLARLLDVGLDKARDMRLEPPKGQPVPSARFWLSRGGEWQEVGL